MFPIERLVAETLALLRPPEKLSYSAWAEKYFVLPEGSSAQPGRFRLWAYQREPLDAMGDDIHERVTWIKSSRIGYTKCLMAAMGARADNDPCSMILLVPTDDDARGFAVDEVEPSFEDSPRLKGLMRAGRVEGRNTLTIKQLAGGGSIKILAARSPRNLRRHDAKVLLVDEEDGMEITAEGDPIFLAERRTFAHADRKIIRGSTPTEEDTSSIAKAYAASDQRVFEVPCPHCGAFFEIVWELIVWPKGEPDKAACRCPHCSTAGKPVLIEERFKTQMVANGRWRVTRPDISGHAGFRINALVSLFANARWGKLAKEWLQACKDGPAQVQAFTNTVLGRVWKSTLESVDEEKLRDRVEDIGLSEGRFPADVLLLVAGVDTQDDRFEVALWGFNETEAFYLAHHVIWGDPADSVTQAELDTLLKTTWRHPAGWTIGIEAVAVDSQGHKTQAVYDFCEPRLGRRIYAIISRSGPRPIWKASGKKPKGREIRIFVVGHDQVKTLVLQRMAIPPVIPDGQDNAGQPSPHRFRYASDLDDDVFDQLTGEKRVVRYARGNKTIIEFRLKKPGQRVEALDCSCYAHAVRFSLKVNFAERRKRAGGAKKSATLGEMSALLNKKG